MPSPLINSPPPQWQAGSEPLSPFCSGIAVALPKIIGAYVGIVSQIKALNATADLHSQQISQNAEAIHTTALATPAPTPDAKGPNLAPLILALASPGVRTDGLHRHADRERESFCIDLRAEIERHRRGRAQTLVGEAQTAVSLANGIAPSQTGATVQYNSLSAASAIITAYQGLTMPSSSLKTGKCCRGSSCLQALVKTGVPISASDVSKV